MQEKERKTGESKSTQESVINSVTVPGGAIKPPQQGNTTSQPLSRPSYGGYNPPNVRVMSSNDSGPPGMQPQRVRFSYPPAPKQSRPPPKDTKNSKTLQSSKPGTTTSAGHHGLPSKPAPKQQTKPAGKPAGKPAPAPTLIPIKKSHVGPPVPAPPGVAPPVPGGYPHPPPPRPGSGPFDFPFHGPMPPGFASPYRDPRGHSQRPDGAPPGSSPGRPPYPQAGDHFPPPPYPMYPPGGRAQGWPPGDPRYAGPHHLQSPYTNAQRNGAKGKKSSPGGPPGPPGRPGPPPGVNANMPPHYRLVSLPLPTKKNAGYNQHRRRSEVLQDARNGFKPRAVEGGGASSPAQIEAERRDSVSNMGCTCRKSKCLKLYCVCFGASVMCGSNCRCMQCNNNLSHEQVRKDAIRSILARNPSAFDTKFRKLNALQGEDPVRGNVPVNPNKALTHKLGCKCRKSFCTKKYCECYNAAIKCSPSCRCVSCKNLPLPPGVPEPVRKERLGRKGARQVQRMQKIAMPPQHPPPHLMNRMPGNMMKPPSSKVPIPIPGRGTVEVSKNVLGARGPERHDMDAAQNLAFLKSSPARKTIPKDGAPPLTATSSSGASSGSLDGGECTKTNPLLLAAVAMTQLGTTEDAEQFADASPGKSPHMKRSNTVNLPPRISVDRILAVASASSMDAVKTKATDTSEEKVNVEQFEDADDEVELPSKDRTPIRTPSDTRESKRPRISLGEGSPATAKKLTYNAGSESSSKDVSRGGNLRLPPDDKPNFLQTLAEQATDVLMNTPQTNGMPNKSVQSPVSARRIDFPPADPGPKSVSTDANIVDEKKQPDSVTSL